MKILRTRHDAVLRLATPDDVPALEAIAIACWAPIYASFKDMLGDEIYAARFGGPDDWQQNKAGQVIGHFERSPESTWVVNRGNDAPFAFITYMLDESTSTGIVGNNGVHPDHAGQGWGSFMYRALLAHFQTLGLRVAMVYTGLDDAHAPARRAYEAAGFDHRTDHCYYYLDLATWTAPSEGD